jgi:hypothetical protein
VTVTGVAERYTLAPSRGAKRGRCSRKRQRPEVGGSHQLGYQCEIAPANAFPNCEAYSSRPVGFESKCEYVCICTSEFHTRDSWHHTRHLGQVRNKLVVTAKLNPCLGFYTQSTSIVAKRRSSAYCTRNSMEVDEIQRYECGCNPTVYGVWVKPNNMECISQTTNVDGIQHFSYG